MSSIRARSAAAKEILSFDLSVAEGLEACPLSRPRLRRLILASLSASKRTLNFGAVISLRLCDVKEAKALNRSHRGKTYAPNVLTFEYPSLPSHPLRADIAICLPVVEKEARQQGKKLDHHFMHLLVHGTLHAVGFDHIEPPEAETMENLERQILKRFRISDPYLVGQSAQCRM
jgi:probable rRNA maturation factor